MSPYFVGMILFSGVGLLLVALGIPLMLGRVRPNGVYGLRTRETLADTRVWTRANVLLGRFHVTLGVGQLILAWGLPWLLNGSPMGYFLVCLAWLLGGVLLSCVSTALFAKKMALSLEPQTEPASELERSVAPDRGSKESSGGSVP